MLAWFHCYPYVTNPIKARLTLRVLSTCQNWRAGPLPDQSVGKINEIRFFERVFAEKHSPLCILLRIWVIWLDSFDYKRNYHYNKNGMAGQFWQMESVLRSQVSRYIQLVGRKWKASKFFMSYFHLNVSSQSSWGSCTYIVARGNFRSPTPSESPVKGDHCTRPQWFKRWIALSNG